MGTIIYSFNLNISPKCHMVCLSVILFCYRITCLWFCNKSSCNKKEVLFVPDPVFWQTRAIVSRSGHCSELAAFFWVVVSPGLCPGSLNLVWSWARNQIRPLGSWKGLKLTSETVVLTSSSSTSFFHCLPFPSPLSLWPAGPLHPWAMICLVQPQLPVRWVDLLRRLTNDTTWVQTFPIDLSKAGLVQRLPPNMFIKSMLE